MILTITGDATDERDNCDVAIGDAVFSDSLVLDFPCTGRSLIYRSWSLTDACGNERVQEQIIVLQDDTPPDFDVPADITLDCSLDYEDITLSGNATNADDNCDSSLGNPTYTDQIINDPSPACETQFIVQRTWSLSDACGNENEQIQTITIIDTIAPTFCTSHRCHIKLFR